MERKDEYLPDKSGVIANFNSAARDYDEVAELQKTVAERLLEHLDPVRIVPSLILDLGAGTGRPARALRKRFKPARVVQLDIAMQMLLHSKKQAPRFFSGQYYVRADAEALPFRPASFDLIYSSLTLQWVHDLDGLFRSLKSCLAPGGLLLFSSLGPDTLKELRESWAEADDAVHVNAFMDMHDVGDGLVRAGFADPVLETEKLIMTYPDTGLLLRDLKHVGAGNINTGRRRSLTGKSRFQRMLDAYSRRKAGGRIPATYEVIYGHAWTPAGAGTKNAGTKTSYIPVSAIKKKHSG